MFRCEISNRIDELPALNARLEECCEGCGCCMEATYAVTLAVEELVTNIIKYGHDDRAAHRILVTVEDRGDAVLLVIEDDGREFNPLEGPPPAFDVPLEERPIGGLGLHLIRELSQSMEHERRDGRNIVRVLIRKKTTTKD